ncbi:MAG TPA: type V CRISPR-associated protein Cas12a/Cpf1 [Bacteroidales bacterium]|nr:type V CRISPR-associated protein Cas12a/Cpf1 [Bacteroidales bacterium]HPS15681.1 type V CRISPR-associated protein Cas12a/Cpf1 [Bacteroidales bacterium]
MKNLIDFTGLYSLSKTLRFELIPQGKTLENIEKKGLLKQDEARAEKYKKVKKIIDEYHKDFIEKSLNTIKLEGLEYYYDLYLKTNKEDKEIKEFSKQKERLRKQIANAFKANEKFKTLFLKELIKEDLLSFVSNEEDKADIKEFKDFTTYFIGFHQNRENMYVAEEKATAIAYRLINENLPKFIDNIKIFEKIKNEAPELINQLNQVLSEMEEIVQGKTLEEIFSLNYFNQTLTQTGIDLYNIVIGGRTPEENKTKIKGLNEYINTDFNQKQTDKKKRQPKFKQLYKQILSDRHSVSFMPESFENDNQLLESIENFYTNELLHYSTEGKSISILEAIKNAVGNLSSFNLSKIYLRNDTSLTDISQKVFGDWGVISKALQDYYEKTNPLKPKEKQEKYEERKDKWLKQDIDIQTLQTAIDHYENETVKEKNNGNVINDYFAKFGMNNESKIDLLQNVYQNYNIIKDLLNTPFPESEKLGSNKELVNLIKAFLDSIMNVIHFVKPLSLKDSDKEKDESFYSLYTGLYDQLNHTISIYNQVRNYLTQKPYSTEKFKLNFENSTLMDGWDLNKEADNTTIILRKDNLFYIGIMDKKNNHIFKHIPEMIDYEPHYEKIIYKYFPDASKMIPKCSTQLKTVVSHFESNITDKIIEGKSFDSALKITKRIFELNNFVYDDISKTMVLSEDNEKRPKMFQKKYLEISKDIDGFKDALKDWINFCIDFLNKYESTKHYSFNFKNSELYNSLDEFYGDIDTQTYKITYNNIPVSFIESLVNEGKLYLFQIYNKDFSPFSKGKPNLHTLYWKMLFDEENLNDVVYKLNGQAEVFYRKSSIKESNKVIHNANETLTNKNPDNEKATSKFDYDIIKDKRYTLDKFQFHVPITMNFKADGILNINPKVNEFLKNNHDVNIIGIDRGERHLLYYTLINQQGEILEQDTLNIIENEKQKVDYHNLLDKKEGTRAEARKDWGTIETIKELKEGYLSQVIHKLTTLMVKHNAIIVMEDLNMGFMRGRQKVEKQVYQKFEKMLIDKLNYLVDKSKKANESGGVLRALQLANKFESFKSMGKQNGFIFYVPAWNTSKMDPVTGFVNLFDTRYENLEKAKAFFNKFNSICYNQTKDYFEFEFNYANYTAKAEGTKTNWILCTYQNRIETFRNTAKNSQWDNREIILTNEFVKLFEQHGIDYKNNNELKSAIVMQTEKAFFERLLYLLKLTLQMRNSITGTETDYLISPVANDEGEFYNSRNANNKLPQNADANGAYNIARKGLWCLQQINKTDDLKKIKLAISNKEWLQFVQNNN